MQTETLDLLYLFAEVSIATVALSGITMVLVASNQKLSSENIARIVTQLAMSSVVVVFSVFPLLLDRIITEDDLVWLVASLVYLVVVIAGNVSRFREAGLIRNLDTRSRVVSAIAGLSAISMLGVNLWLQTDFPYLIQLFVAWIVSLVLFGGFIYEMLSTRGT